MRTSSNSSHTPHDIITLMNITKCGVCGTCGASFDFYACIDTVTFWGAALESSRAVTFTIA